VLSGAELTGAAKQRYAQIQERMAELQQKFSENTLDATDAYAYYATEPELDGVPDDVRQAAHAAAQAEGKDGFKLTLKMPCYLPVMQFAQQQRTARAPVPRLHHARLRPGRGRCHAL
jgi:oligopeptidase A